MKNIRLEYTIEKDLECIYCNTKFSVEIQVNYAVICPCCKRSIYLECEYGHGPVTPCQVYLGKEIVGVIESEVTGYYLKMNGRKIHLNETYMDAISEAVEIIKKRLNIWRPNENIQILTKGGSLCFYGEWSGRPYDNYHKIIHTSYDGEILEIIFKQRTFRKQERLLVYKPENIASTEKDLKIAKAQKLKWIYAPNGTIATQNIITYTTEGGILSKETKYGIERVKLKEPFDAVYMG